MLEQVREQATGMLDRGHSHSKSLGCSRDCEEARVWPEHKEHTKGSDQRREGTGGGRSRGALPAVVWTQLTLTESLFILRSG